MKKLPLYIFLVLLWCNISFSQISLSDIKIGSKLSDYFTFKEISKYYRDDMENNAKGEKVWGKDLKYSAIAFYGNEIGDDHDFIQIYYENKNDKIVAISAVTIDLELNQCIQLRDNKVSNHLAKKLLLNFTKDKDSHTFPDGMKDEYVIFRGIKTNVGFRCYIYEDGNIVYRYSDVENNYNEWLFKQFDER